MEIIQNSTEKLNNKLQKKVVKEQRKICPCCGRKRGWLERFFLDRSVEYNKERSLTRIRWATYWKCGCKGCGAIWTTDSILLDIL